MESRAYLRGLSLLFFQKTRELLKVSIPGKQRAEKSPYLNQKLLYIQAKKVLKDNIITIQIQCPAPIPSGTGWDKTYRVYYGTF